jgi:Grx4 family monothiol glutaredoxin
MSSSNSSSLVEITSGDVLHNLLHQQDNQQKIVLLFGADWHESTPMLKMVLNLLAQEKTSVVFGVVDAEGASDISDKYQVTMVPTVLLFNGPVVVERLEGSLEPSQITVAVQRLIDASDGGVGVAAAAAEINHNQASSSGAPSAKDPQQVLNERLEKLIRGDTVMLFMKGTPSAPRCGFSRQAVELLTDHQVPFGSFDILSDESVRQGLKTYSDWPTYPQIYVKGELVGGLDILKETAAEGPLKEQWEISDASAGGTTGTESLTSRLEKLVRRHKVMLFMKGLPSAPRCGFSRQIVEILDESGEPYDAFNILEDEEVRQGLKEFSDWPTYVSLLDAATIWRSRMLGGPCCSRHAIEGRASYAAALTDGIAHAVLCPFFFSPLRSFSQTVHQPQLYVNGELVGGLDIVKELKESGELEDTLKA